MSPELLAVRHHAELAAKAPMFRKADHAADAFDALIAWCKSLEEKVEALKANGKN